MRRNRRRQRKHGDRRGSDIPDYSGSCLQCKIVSRTSEVELRQREVVEDEASLSDKSEISIVRCEGMAGRDGCRILRRGRPWPLDLLLLGLGYPRAR